MILYTMMPRELIFSFDQAEYGKYSTINHNGIPLLVELASDGDFQVVRVLSSNPQHFLDSRYIPGSKISLP